VIYFTFRDAPIKVSERSVKHFSGQAKIERVNRDYRGKEKWVVLAVKAKADKGGEAFIERYDCQLTHWLLAKHNAEIMDQLSQADRAERRIHG
jgi:hypothetical protein